MNKFLNLNLAGDKPQYTQKDVTSEKPEVSEEKVDSYDQNSITTLSSLAKAIDPPEKTNKAFNFKFIPREKLVFNKNNDFNMHEVKELSTKILENGLLHNLAALYDSDTDAYILESGERRLRACDLAHEHFKDFENKTAKEYVQYLENVRDFYVNGFPVNVKKPKYQEDEKLSEVDNIDSELRKYTANIDVRTFTAPERATYIQKVKELLEKKNKLLYGEQAPETTMAQVAAAAGITERQGRKYEAINELIPALKAEFENGNLSINKVPTIAKMSEAEQLVFLDFLQHKGNIDPAQVKLYMERADRAEQEKLELKEEKEQIESDLEEIRASRDAEIDQILEESKAKEQRIRDEIAKAEKEKNEDRIVKLQKELADEKDSASRMIKDTNNRLEKSQNALSEANQRIQQLENKETNMGQIEELHRVRAELDMNLSFLINLCGKTLESLESYKTLAEDEDVEAITEKIMKELQGFIAVVGDHDVMD